MSKILGLDMGANSIGWALLDDENHEVIDLGSRIFTEGYENFGEGEKEETRNKARREARLIRRQYMRRRRRRKKLESWLRRAGLLDVELNDVRFTAANPYQLRADALERTLTPLELSIALYHLNQRRGFKSNRKVGSLSDASALYNGSDEAVGMNETLERFDPETQTWGQFLASLDKTERKRARYTLRKWYMDEFEQIWEAQRQYHPALDDDENKRYVRDQVMFFQRPLKSQKDKVGKCMLEDSKRRAPYSHPAGEYFRMLQQVNNLTIEYPGREGKDPETGIERKILTPAERGFIIDYLLKNESLELKNLARTIKSVAAPVIPSEYQKKGAAKVNLEGQTKIHGCKFVVALRKAVGEERFAKLGKDEIEHVWKLLYDDDGNLKPGENDYLKRSYLAAKLHKKFPDWPAEVVRQIAGDDEDEDAPGIQLAPDYGKLSLKAMRNLIPYLEDGAKYHEACELFSQDNPDYPVRYHHSDVAAYKPEKILDLLPPPADLRNPAVNTALRELRRVVNAVIKRYGKPDKIKVELARELKQNKKKRKDAQDKNKKRYDLNEVARREIAKHRKQSPQTVRSSDIMKYKLWTELGGESAKCPFSGEPIAFEDLFNGRAEVEHIFPRSRRPDDSYMNKTLAFREENQKKGDRTPYEAFGHDKAKMAGIIERTKGLPEAKARKFTMTEEEFAEENEGFIERQLNDTRYMSREAAKYLKCLGAEVQPLAGGVTSMLRNAWGLQSNVTQETHEKKVRPEPFIQNPYLDFELHESEIGKGGKNRLDHRHHAVDAVVIALTTRSHVMAAAKRSKGGKRGLEDRSAVLPWPNLVKQVKDRLDCCVISFRKDPVAKVQGAMHKETIYARLRGSDGKPLEADTKGYGVYASRAKLSAMKDQNDVENIADPVIREAARAHLRAQGVDADARDKKGAPKYSFKAGLLEGLKHPATGDTIRAARKVKNSATLFRNRKPDPRFKRYDNYFVQNDGNHHLALFETTDKKGQLKRDGIVVTLLEAYRRTKGQTPPFDPVDRTQLDGQFLFTLQINDLVYLGDPADLAEIDLQDKRQYKKLWISIYRVQKLAQPKRFWMKHHSMAKLVVLNSDEKKVEPGSENKMAGTFEGVKLRIDPAGYLTIAND